MQALIKPTYCNLSSYPIGRPFPAEDSLQQAPGVGTDGILQLKGPLAALHLCAAEKHLGFHTYIMDILNTNDLFDLHRMQLLQFILHPQPQGPDRPVGRAYGYQWACH